MFSTYSSARMRFHHSRGDAKESSLRFRMSLCKKTERNGKRSQTTLAFCFWLTLKFEGLCPSAWDPRDSEIRATAGG